MSLYDRDWVREEYKKKELKYGSSNKSTKKELKIINGKIHIPQSIQNDNIKTEYCSRCKRRIDVNTDWLFKPFIVAYKFKCPICGKVNTRYTWNTVIQGLLCGLFFIYILFKNVSIL